MSPLVSVVIPSYNHSAYLPEAITSVLSQSGVQLELIIIDDGSTDASWALIEEAARGDDRIRALRQENRGAHAAITRGLQLAGGQFLTVLNSDDRYRPDRLATLVALADANEGLDFIATGLQLIDAQGQPITHHPWLEEYHRMQARVRTHGLWAGLIERNFTVSTSNFFMRRRLWEELGPFRSLRYNMDWDYALRAWRHDPKRCAWRDDLVLWDYRLHGDNTILGGLPVSAIEANHLLYGVLARHYDVPDSALAGLRRHHRLIRRQQAVVTAHARDAEWEQRQAAWEERNAEWEQRQVEWAKLQVEWEERLASVHASWSYRLGHALLTPVRWLRDLRSTTKLNQTPPAYRPIELPEPSSSPPPRVAVHLHLHYPELLDELLATVANLPDPFDLLVTTTQPAADIRLQVRAQYPQADIRQVPNQGRDIGPFIDTLSRFRLDEYDLVLKLHGKKSRNEPGYLDAIRQLFGADIRNGDDWRRRLIAPIAGDRDRVLRIYQAFAENSDMMAAGAARFVCSAADADADSYRELCRRVGVSHEVCFFAGTMFWIRGKTLTPLRAAGLRLAEFDPADASKVEGTLEHGCERLFGALAAKNGGYLAGLDDVQS